MTVAFTRGDVERMVKTFTVNGTSTVTVSAPEVTANSIILQTLKTVGGTVGSNTIQTVTPGTGFTLTSTAGNTSTYNYVVL